MLWSRQNLFECLYFLLFEGSFSRKFHFEFDEEVSRGHFLFEKGHALGANDLHLIVRDHLAGHGCQLDLSAVQMRHFH